MSERLTQRERSNLENEITRLEARNKNDPKLKMLKRRIQWSDEANARDEKKGRRVRTY